MPRFVLAALVVFLGLPAQSLAFCRTTTQNAQPDFRRCPDRGRPIAWAGGCTDYALDPRVLPSNIPLAEFRSAVALAASAWAEAVCDPATGAHPSFRLVAAPDATLPVGYAPGGPNANTIAFRADWGRDSFHPPDAAAVTVVTFGAASAAILDTDVEVNLAVRFSTTGARDAADLATILTHELGHVQGLAHSPEMNAVMWYSAGRGEQRRMLSPDDLAGICAVYPAGRRVACEPAVRSAVFAGGGATCAARPAPASPRGGAWAALVALAAVVARRRRATAARRG